MATNKPRFSVTFTEESFEKIHEFQKENKISTQSRAVARLVEIALNELENEGVEEFEKKASIDGICGIDLKKTLVENFDQLNKEGQERLVETSDDMVSSGKYIKSHKAEMGEGNYA